MERDLSVVAYFDFDGTVTTHDTLIPFLFYVVGPFKFFLKLPQLLAIAIRYYLKIITNEAAKEQTLSLLLKNKKLMSLDKKAYKFARKKLAKYIKPEIFARILHHQEQKHKVIIVSANLAIYLNYFINIHNIGGVIATEMEFIDGRFSGKLKTRNCYGQEKVKRINEYLHDTKQHFAYSYGYGNSAGDYELLLYVDEPYWIKGSEILAWNKH